MWPLTSGACVVVGGHSRGVGKTLFIEQWIRARPGESWIAIKVSAHRHAPADLPIPLIEEAHEPSPCSQTGRYLAAGAVRAFLVRAPAAALPQVAGFIAALRRTAKASRTAIIIESNRIVRHLRADRVFFVVDREIGDFKPSSVDCLRVPTVTIVSHQRGLRHDSYIVTPAVGNGAALGTDSPHRVPLSRGVAC